MTKIVTALLCCFLGWNFCLKTVWAQLDVPPIGCPNYFQYLRDGNRYFGKLTLPNLSINGFDLELVFSQKELRGDYDYGSVALFTSNEANNYHLTKNIPVSFRVDFPIPTAPPKLTKIIVNNQLLCDNPDDGPTSIMFTQQLRFLTDLFFGNSSDIVVNYTLIRTTTARATSVIKLPPVPFVPTEPIVWSGTESAVPTESPHAGFEYKTTPRTIPTSSVEIVVKAPSPIILPPLEEIPIESIGAPVTIVPVESTARPMTVAPVESTARPMTVAPVESTARPMTVAPVESTARPMTVAPVESTETRVPPGPVEPTQQSKTESSVSESIKHPVSTVDCGIPTVETPKLELVSGGLTVSRGQFPWLAAIYKPSFAKLDFLCGGSLVSANTVVSAAHCFESERLKASEIVVYLGRLILSYSEDGTNFREVRNLLINPQFDQNRYPDADLAILQLKNSVKFSQFIRPICLWSDTSDKSLVVGQRAFVAGWNFDRRRRLLSSFLKYGNANIVSDSVCLRTAPFAYSKLTSPRILCAGNQDENGPCIGDSGGGLMIYRNGRWMLRGVASVSQCNPRAFVLYTDVAKHLSWLQNNII